MMAKARLNLKSIRARPGSRLSHADAKVIARELFAIEQKFDHVTPDAVLKRAEHSRSPLHKHFTWDDSEAAAAYRIEEARTLIRGVVYEVIVDGQTDKPMRGFQPALVNIRSSAEDEDEPRAAGYIRVERALDDEKLRAKIMEQAARELDAWVRRYNTLEALVETASVKRIVSKIRQRVQRQKGR